MMCRICGSPAAIDTLVVADAVRAMDPGYPVPVVFKCVNGHSSRVSPVAASLSAQAAAQRPVLRCAVCGVELTRQRGAAPRKSCSPEHKRFIEVKRAEAAKLHRATGDGPFHFLIEAQPWYRGAATVFRPPAPPTSWTLFPEIPADWLEGFRQVYPLEYAPALRES